MSFSDFREVGSEKCGCGASVTVTAYSAESLRQSLSAWRAEHLHEFPAVVRAVNAALDHVQALRGHDIETEYIDAARDVALCVSAVPDGSE